MTKRLFCMALLFLWGFAAYAQQKVTGTVTGVDDGKPVEFATVIVKGFPKSVATTDVKGVYSITLPSGATTLGFSFFGMKEVEVIVNGQSVINVVMEPDAQMLDETIVVAYGTAKKGTYTGAASVLKQDAIKDVPNLSFQNAMNGKVAGMQVTTSTGQAGSSPSIRVRGTGSMNASNDPLYVIDGIPVVSGSLGQLNDVMYTSINNAMSGLNPADIESITVLKDAAASALYGSRAANGVILVQTKRGKLGKTKVDLKASFGFSPSFATDNYETASTQQQIEMEYELFWNVRKSQGQTDAQANTYALGQLNTRFNKHGYIFSAPDNTAKSLTVTGDRAGTEFDWDKVLFRTATFQTYDLSVSGATELTNYFTSFSYTKENGRSRTNDYDRISGRLNLTQKIMKVLELSSNLSLSKSDQQGFNDSNNVGQNYFMQSRNLLWPLYWPTKYQDGTMYTDRYGSMTYNYEYYKDTWDNGAKTLRISAIESLTAHILPELKAKTTFSFDNTSTSEFLFYSPEHYSSGTTKGSVDNYNTTLNKLVSSTTVDYTKLFAEKHNVSLLVGFEAEKNRTDYIRASGTNLPTSVLETVAPAGKLDATAYWWGNNMLSFLSRAEYSYRNRYYLSGSFRRDGSSKFGGNNKWGNFWSVAGSWRVSNEAFMKGAESWLSNLRLRASYGVNGTLPAGTVTTSNYGHMSLTSYSAYKYMTNPGGALTSIPNPDLSWESNYTTNVAVEFGLFKNRISGTIEYFNRDSKNVLQEVPISMITGLSTTFSNIGEMNNRGLEIELNANVLKIKDFSWDVGVAASIVKSKMTDLYDGSDIIKSTAFDGRGRYILREGYSPLSFYGYEWAGVERETGKNLWYLNNDKTPDLTVNGRPATYSYNKADEIIIGTADPDLFGGFSSNFRWKGITLDIGFIYKMGGNTYDFSSGRETADDGWFWERTRSQYEYDNRWTPEDKDSKLPQIIGLDLTDVRQHSSRHLHDASFLRLKSLTLAYSLPKSILSKVNIANARIYFNGSNLWTLAAYKVYDPEVGTDGTRGWEMPISKTFTFGLEIGF